MREIKFKALYNDGLGNTSWVYGSLVKKIFDGMISYDIECADISDYRCYHNVIAESIGQFTGLLDCKRTKEFHNGQEIYEGDVVKDFSWGTETKEKIVYYENGFYFDDGIYSNWNAKDVVVIGNIHDNHELIGGKK